MKHDRKTLAAHRQMLDRNLQTIQFGAAVPHTGWLKAVRTSLGLTVRQMAKRLKLSPMAVSSIEKNETAGKAALSSIERSARAMDCELVYAIVPRKGFHSLDEILNVRSRALAKRLLKKTAHTMRLEDQALSPEAMAAQESELAAELKANLDPRLWEVEF